jgi:SAM-dependent methyltransferase
MQPEKLTSLWTTYRQTPINMTIDPSDNMFSTDGAKSENQRRLEYTWVGESGAKVVFATLASALTEDVKRILDFASGAGRGARHLRAMFPDAQMYFSDIDPLRAEFCARQFGGEAIVSDRDFSRLNLPRNLDLIWVGSLFTHVSYPRMEVLFDSLWGALKPKGTLIATFHGRHIIAQHPKMTFIKQESWDRILKQYHAAGVGYESYGLENLGDIGVSLISVERVVALGGRHADARLVSYSEVGWAGLQDVAAWSKTEI